MEMRSRRMRKEGKVASSIPKTQPWRKGEDLGAETVERRLNRATWREHLHEKECQQRGGSKGVIY